MDFFYRFILIGMHFIVSFFIFIVNIVRGLKKVFSDIVCFRLPATQSQKSTDKNDISQLIPVVKCLNKIPQHFVLLLAEDKISFNDVAKIVRWCVAAGIYHVSVYDHEGVIKKSMNDIEELLQIGQKNGLKEKIAYCISDQLPDSSLLTKANNSSEKQNCYVTFLSSLDGRNGIARSAVDLAQKVIEKCIDAANFKLSDLEKKLLNPEASPYPNLMICCGKIRSTIGFLPWHLHLTEILYHETLHQFTMQDFIKTLLTYSNCEQRLGK